MNNGINSIEQSPFQDLGFSEATRKKSNELDQKDFMKLMVAQMNYQNPLEPESNTEFLSQMAQFGTVNGISDLNQSISSISVALQSNQALQAASLVGKSVVIPSDTLNYIQGETKQGSVDLNAQTNQLKLSIFNEAGEKVRDIDLGNHAEGSVDFAFDGKDDSGNLLPSGAYSMKAEGKVGGVNTSYSTNILANVDSVTIDKQNQGILLNLAGLGTVPFNVVERIK